MKLDIRACDADVPIPKKVIRNGNIVSSAVFENDWVWQQGSKGEITITFDSNGAASYIGSVSNRYNPSMMLGWVDPPLSGSFDMDGYTFTFDATCEHRNGCSQNCYNNCCSPYCTPGSKNGDYTCFGVNNSSKGYYCAKNWTPGGVVIHEFGHALGMGHEHQNFLYGEPIQYDKDGATLSSMVGLLGLDTNDPCVQTYCTKLCFDNDVRPSFCGQGCNPNVNIDSSCQNKINEAKQLAINNILDKYECTSTNCPYSGSPFDPDSVMVYDVADYLIKPNANGERINPTYENYQLSATDKAQLQIRYPLNSNNKPEIKVRFVDGPNWKKYWVKKVVKEMIEPFVGINFVFDLPVNVTASPTNAPITSDARLPTNAPITTNAPTNSPTSKPTSSPIFGTQDPKNESESDNIITKFKDWISKSPLNIFFAIIIGGVIIIFVSYLIGYFNKKISKK